MVHLPVVPAIPAPDSESFATAVATLSATPRGVSYGQLVPAVAWLSSCQGAFPPADFRTARAVIFAGEHGIAHQDYEGAGLSAFSPEATAQQVSELNAGAGPAAIAARIAGVSVRVIDEFLDSPSAAVDQFDALTEDAAAAAFERGMRIADEEIDAGSDLLIPGDLGVGNTTIAAIIAGTLLFKEPVAIVGPGSGTSDEMWKTKVTVIRDAMFRVRNFYDDPYTLARLAGSADFMAMVGFIIQAASRRTPMLIDGALTAAALLVAQRLAPGVSQWVFAASESTEPVFSLVRKELDLDPLLQLQVRTGQATGALMALPLLRTAVELAADEAALVTD